MWGEKQGAKRFTGVAPAGVLSEVPERRIQNVCLTWHQMHSGESRQ